MIVKTNILALNSLNSLKRVELAQGSVIKKLSSGKRINSAADDATGTAMRANKDALIRGSEQASRNTQDGISITQTAQGGIDVIHDMVHRIRELAIESANDAITSDDRQKIQYELDHITAQITKIAEQTTFNGRNLLATDDVAGGGLVIHVSSQPMIQVIIERTDITAAKLGLDTIDLTTSASSDAALAVIDGVIDRLATEQVKYGSYQSRLEQVAGNLGLITVNAYTSKSRIVDADMAEEALKMTKYNILNMSTNMMLANANQNPENVLRLVNR